MIKMNHKNSMTRRLYVWIVFITIILLSTFVNGKEIGNITVYVKDQNGNNVIDNEHLIGDLTVELWYNEKMEDSQIFHKDNESVTFEVNHTGLYTIRAVAILGNYLDYYGCPYHEYPPPLYSCLSKCPDGTSTVGIDDRGVYRCVECSNVVRCKSNDYILNRTYIIVNDVKTYVDEGENDIAQVTIPTNERIFIHINRNY